MQISIYWSLAAAIIGFGLYAYAAGPTPGGPRHPRTAEIAKLVGFAGTLAFLLQTGARLFSAGK